MLTPRLLYFKQCNVTEEVMVQQTQEQVLYLFSTKATQKPGVVRSDMTVPCCALVLLRMPTSGIFSFIFKNEWGFFFQYNVYFLY